MKKPFSIVILGLLLTANGMASDKKYSLFGVIIGDDINNYNPKAGIIKSHLIIDPPKPNKNLKRLSPSSSNLSDLHPSELKSLGVYYSSALQVPVRHCSPKPLPEKQGFLSLLFRVLSSLKCSLVLVPAVFATCSKRPKKTVLA